MRVSAGLQPIRSRPARFKHKVESAATEALWRGAGAALGAAFGWKGVALAAVGSGVVGALREENPSRKLSSALSNAAYYTVWSCTGAMFGLPGAVTSAATGIWEGLKSEDRSLEQRALHLSETPTGGSKPIHLISVVDGSDSLAAPYASEYLQLWEEAKAVDPQNLRVDLRLERTNDAFFKLFAGSLSAAVTLAGAGVAGPGWLGAGIAAVALQLQPGRIFSNLSSGASDLTLPFWSGTRHFEVIADQTRGFDSPASFQAEAPTRGREVDPVTEFLRQNMGKYPGSLQVVHLAGHGHGYHANSGFSSGEFKKVVDILEQSPPEVLLLDSCLGGNLENVAQLKDAAGYIVVSEENIPIGDLPQSFKAALQAGTTPDARSLGLSLINHARSGPNTASPTLALVDTSELPSLLQAVDGLGSRLAQEGRNEVVEQAIRESKRFPHHGWLKKRLLNFGDLKMFAQNLARNHPLKATRAQADLVLKELAEAVPAHQSGAEYAQTGGLSVQLPGSGNQKLRGLLPRVPHQLSASPAGWKAFVEAYN